MTTTFGYSAFLRLIHLNPRPQSTALKQRLAKSDSGYDFHRRLRRDVGKFFADERSLPELLSDVSSVVRDAERRSLEEGLKRAAQWRALQAGSFISLPAAVYESPRALYRVKLSPEFGYLDANGCVAVHVWNTGKIKLDPRLVYSTLALFSNPFRMGEPKADVAMLCLKTLRLFRLAPTPELLFVGIRIASALETVFENLRDRPADHQKRIPPPAPT